MESSYDEDLSENIFLDKLQSEHAELFDKAICDGWVICVPRSGSFTKYTFTHDDFFNHILIPSDELPETHFRTLNNKDIRICNKLITLEPSDISKPFTTHILFEETFYTDEYLKYKLLCIERPLEPCLVDDENKSSFISVQTLRDCIDLLWTESTGKFILEKMDEIISEFLETNHDLEYKTLQVQRDTTGRLYSKCLQVCLKDSRLRGRTCVNKHFLENVKVAVESYVHHHIYKKLIKGVTACTAYDDALLNKTIRNLSDLQLGDLDIRSDLHDTVPKARSELARVDGYSTVLGKLGCLKRCLSAIAQESMNHSEGNIVNADDLLPIFVFLIIKTNLPNWIAHLTYLSQFRFSSSNQMVADTSTFLITSLEAAIEHIKSGSLLGSPVPESQLQDTDYPDSALTYEMSNMKSYQANLKPRYNTKSSLYTLFEETRCGNLENVKSILDNNNISGKTTPDETQLCHPLCSCDNCEKQMSIILCNTVPTVYSCDDRGFTVLHIACLFGRPKIVDLLLNYGANPNVLDYSGSTPLHYAAARGHQNALLLILHATSDIVEQQDNEGNTALHLATENGHDGCVKALLYFAEHNGISFDINKTNNQGDTALHFAARWGYENLVQLLCDYNANPLIENKRKSTPIDCAHNLYIANILSEHLRVNKPVLHLIRPYPKKSELVAAASSVSLDFSDVSDSFISTEEYGTRPQTMNQIKRVEKLLRAIEFNDVRLMSYYLGFDEPVIFGPMFSGKSTELIRRLKRYQFANYRCLVVRYANDNRYDTQALATHDKQKLAAVSATVLTDLKRFTDEVDVIGIDEGQFFSDVVPFCEEMANKGKIVVVAALDGTFQRTGFGDILSLVPLAESVVKLTAVCMSCFADASYTKRLGNEKEVEIIGGADKYMAVCRECHRLSSPVKRSPFKALDQPMIQVENYNHKKELFC